MSLRLSGLGVAVLMLGTRVASAQDATAGAVMAYDQAEALMAQGRIAEACPRYAESQRLDPQLGTLLHLAECLERNGQTASAWAKFREAAELAEKKGDPRQAVAKERADALAPRLSRLTIHVAQTPNLQIERDAVPIGQTQWGTAVPTDPGLHRITASAPGYQLWSGLVEVRADASTAVINVPQLQAQGAVAVAAVPPAPPPPVQPAQAQPPPAAPKEEEAEPVGRWPAVLVGVVGLAGIGFGTAFGLRSMSLKDQSGEHCVNNLCDPEGVTLKDDAISAGNVSTVGFVIGGIGLAAATVLWFTLPTSKDADKKAAAPRLRVGLGSAMTLEQTW